MNVGFTGTRELLAEPQYQALLAVLIELEPDELHQGCCVNGDEAATVIASFELPRRPWIVAHPPTDTKLVSAASLMFSDEKRKPLPYLARNRAIVDATSILVACPKGPEEMQGSGTWATIRYARRLGRATKIIWPNGQIKHIPGL